MRVGSDPEESAELVIDSSTSQGLLFALDRRTPREGTAVAQPANANDG
jgi:hypothetical protein